MKFKLQVSLGDGVVLVRTLEADRMRIRQLVIGGKPFDLDSGSVEMVGVRATVTKDEFRSPVTEFENVVTLEVVLDD